MLRKTKKNPKETQKQKPVNMKHKTAKISKQVSPDLFYI